VLLLLPQLQQAMTQQAKEILPITGPYHAPHQVEAVVREGLLQCVCYLQATTDTTFGPDDATTLHQRSV
jgi:hypothetical protein